MSLLDIPVEVLEFKIQPSKIWMEGKQREIHGFWRGITTDPSISNMRKDILLRNSSRSYLKKLLLNEGSSHIDTTNNLKEISKIVQTSMKSKNKQGNQYPTTKKHNIWHASRYLQGSIELQSDQFN